MSSHVDSFDHLVLNVQDVEVSAAWYQTVLGMRREEFDPGQGKPKRIALKFGANKINLRPANASTEDWFTAEQIVPGTADLCFLTSDTPEAVERHLRECAVEILLGPTKKQGAQGVLNSVYCRDPDGSLIEISSYEDR